SCGRPPRRSWRRCGLPPPHSTSQNRQSFHLKRIVTPVSSWRLPWGVGASALNQRAPGAPQAAGLSIASEEEIRMRGLAAVLLLLTSACVTKGTYEALQTEHDATLDQLKARNHTLETREKELEAARSQTRDLERALEDEKEKQAALTEQMRTLEDRQAKMLKDKTTLEASVSE